MDRFRCAIFLLIWQLGVADALAAAGADITRNTGIYTALSLGTAWAITDKHVVTNYHVIADTRNLRLVTPGQLEIPVSVIATDPKNDLAILAIKGDRQLSATLPISDTAPGLGAAVFTIGYPHPDLMGTSPKLTSGHVNALSGIADDPGIFQVDVPVQAGNSGGPLLNMYGEVVAIITSKLNAKKMFERTGDIPQNVNYAIKIERLNSLLKKIKLRPQQRQHSNKKQTLETLAEQTLDSVLIIAGDAEGRQDSIRILNYSITPNLDETKDTTKPVNITKYTIYSYAEPGNHDTQEGIIGSSTARNYSKNTSQLIYSHLQKMYGSRVSINILSGPDIKHVHYELDDEEKSKQYCQGNKADKILSSFSDKNPGVHFRYVNFKLLDCKTMRIYRKLYTIERDEINDSFGYEMELHSSFKDFIFKLPPFISMAN